MPCGAAQAAAERHRAELRAEQGREQSALEGERAALAAQVRAAYMIGRQEQLKLLLNQSNPASLGRTLAYYGYFARERSGKIDVIQGMSYGCSSWSTRSTGRRRAFNPCRPTPGARWRNSSVRAASAPMHWPPSRSSGERQSAARRS